MQTSNYTDRISALPSQVNLSAWVFWITFILSYLISRVLSIATYGVYRAGAVVLFLAVLLVLSRLSLLNRQLLITVLFLGGVVLVSAIINRSSLPQFVAFFRIPITAYLVYYLVAVYLNNRQRVEKVWRIMYFIAVIQLPVLIAQRLAYPFLPDRIKFSTSLGGQLALVDFGIGTFDGDAEMSFCLIALVILLLFWDQSAKLIKYKWPAAIWLTLTVLVANSQIQHFLIAGVWALYFLSNLRPKTVMTIGFGIAFLFVILGYFERAQILTFPPVIHTLYRVPMLFTDVHRQERIDMFLSGGHERDGALYYFFAEPVNWLGDGPGRYYNTLTRERSLGTWGHLFTFYSEIGMIGWILSMVVFFIIAFPFSIDRSKISVQVSWVQALMFLSVCVLTVTRYPMNTIPMIFTYCVVLIGYRIVAQPKQLRIL
jgi:hypothetical protein